MVLASNGLLLVGSDDGKLYALRDPKPKRSLEKLTFLD